MTDADAYPNSGPFTCQLANSGFMQTAVIHDASIRSSVASTTSTASSSSSTLFSVRTMEHNQSSSSSNNSSQMTMMNSDSQAKNEIDYSRGECLIYAIDRLPVSYYCLLLFQIVSVYYAQFYRLLLLFYSFKFLLTCYLF
ncbi:unnamed protein product [Trichobilharzia regenti]|nr:unnamed protein product [Trichobilharzia regenti]